MVAMVFKLLLEVLNALNAILDAGERGIQFRGWLRKRPPAARLGISLLALAFILTAGFVVRQNLWHRTESVPVLPGVLAIRPQPREVPAPEESSPTPGVPSPAPPTSVERPRVSEARPEVVPPVAQRPQIIYQAPGPQTGASGALPETVYALLSEGQSLHGRGDYRGAGRLYRNALAQVPPGSGVEADRVRAELVGLIRDVRSGCESDPTASC